MTYSYNSYDDYAEAYDYDSADDYAKARAAYNDESTGHHPSICSRRCPCKTQPRDLEQLWPPAIQDTSAAASS
jgi:hypothetical protein